MIKCGPIQSSEISIGHMPAGPQRRRARDPQRQLDHTPTSRGKSPASGDVRCRSPHADPVGKWFRTASDNRPTIASTSLAPAPDRHRFGKGTDQIRRDLASAGFEKTGIANQTGRETSGSETGRVLSGTNGRHGITVQKHGL